MSLRQIALLQGSSAIAQGAQAFIIGNFAGLATQAFASCTVWGLRVRVIYHYAAHAFLDLAGGQCCL